MITQNSTSIRLKPVRRGVRESAEMQEKRFGYFPKRFRWRGLVHDVIQVERCWTIMKPLPSFCFRVRCREGYYDLFHDVRTNSWEVAKI